MLEKSESPSLKGLGLGLPPAVMVLAGCLFFDDPLLEAPPVLGRAKFQELRFDPRWYRTYDSASNIDIEAASGSLLFAWTFGDSTLHPDSFYVGIDTLWALPQDVPSFDSAGVPPDTGNDWDLQICPDGNCLLGLKANVHGADGAFHFGDTLASGERGFQTEHHFQFWGAIDARAFRFTAPPNSLFGGMLFARSRTSGRADTVFGYGAWELEWDSAYIPPVRPVAGYRPRRSDFVIVGNKVRYVGP